MNNIINMAIMVLFFLYFVSGATADTVSPTAAEITKFAVYIKKYGKSYTTSELKSRVQIFAENCRMMDAHNSGNSTYQMGINQFTDLSFEEFDALQGFVPDEAMYADSLTVDPSNTTAPLASIDWVSKGKVVAVKNQLNCGSCYSFGAMGSIESAYAIKGHGLHDLSEQQFLDCNGVKGCNGGNANYVINWVSDNGACGTSAYPYIGKVGTCKSCTKVLQKGVVTGSSSPSAKTEAALQVTMNQQPVEVSVYASHWGGYSGGIFQDSDCNQSPNHSVLVVGYGTTSNGQPFWKIKNSWGTGWGEGGYMRMIRGKNMCNIQKYMKFPVLR